MDARLDPAKALGLSEGDAHVIRNAGGRTIDALSLGRHFAAAARDPGDCHRPSYEQLRAKVRKDLGEDVDHISFLPFGDVKQSVWTIFQVLKKSPLVLDVPISGYIYDVASGKIERVDN
ncbi:hypothetical protein J3459_022327 [Metarhizium acridum]|nr:hypothetical protein J3459_022327 [Metarhizium acridum]